MQHDFEKVYFGKPTWCTFCKEFIYGVFKKQGYRCRVCKGDAHSNCRIEAISGMCPGKNVFKDGKRTGDAPPDADRYVNHSASSANLVHHDSSTTSESHTHNPTPKPVESTQPPVITPPPVKPRNMARALFEFPPENDRELELKKGDLVEVLKTDEEWWFGMTADGTREGYFPGNYVQKVGDW